jgi:Ni,Fe-hydrogenase I large subunit
MHCIGNAMHAMQCSPDAEARRINERLELFDDHSVHSYNLPPADLIASVPMAPERLSVNNNNSNISNNNNNNNKNNFNNGSNISSNINSNSNSNSSNSISNSNSNSNINANVSKNAPSFSRQPSASGGYQQL